MVLQEAVDGSPGLVWLNVACSCEAGWMYCQILTNTEDVKIQFAGNTCGGHFFSQHADSITPSKLTTSVMSSFCHHLDMPRLSGGWILDYVERTKPFVCIEKDLIQLENEHDDKSVAFIFVYNIVSFIVLFSK